MIIKILVYLHSCKAENLAKITLLCTLVHFGKFFRHFDTDMKLISILIINNINSALFYSEIHVTQSCLQNFILVI